MAYVVDAPSGMVQPNTHAGHAMPFHHATACVGCSVVCGQRLVQLRLDVILASPAAAALASMSSFKILDKQLGPWCPINVTYSWQSTHGALHVRTLVIGFASVLDMSGCTFLQLERLQMIVRQSSQLVCVSQLALFLSFKRLVCTLCLSGSSPTLLHQVQLLQAFAQRPDG